MIFDSLFINTHRSYKALIGEDLYRDIPDLISDFLCSESIVIVSDDNVFPLYGEDIFFRLSDSGCRVFKFIFPHGEDSKSLEVYGRLLNFLCTNNITRQALIIALGGGVVGDLAGFAASTFKRGVNYIQIPTTLLAMVDSSIGGKTGINLPKGKNMAGSIFQPVLVLCDVNALNTLSDIEIKSGYGEIVKYGILQGEPLISKLSNNSDGLKPDIISECIDIKRAYVEEDEFENGKRVMLNLGHSLGHAIEVCSGCSIPHGIAVANGIALITQIAFYYGFCDKITKDRINHILLKYDLIYELNFSIEDIVNILLNDKKSMPGIFRFILPVKAGQCKIYDVRYENLFDWINTGLCGSINPRDTI